MISLTELDQLQEKYTNQEKELQKQYKVSIHVFISYGEAGSPSIGHWIFNAATVGSNPALATSWCCSGLVPGSTPLSSL